MPTPFRIKFLPEVQQWVPNHEGLETMAAFYHDGVTPRSLIVDSLFAAVDSNLAGQYEIVDAVTLADAMAESFAKINQRTLEIVETGFEYQMLRFPCTQVAQIRYLGMYNFRDQITYPLSLSTIDDMATVQMTSATDVLYFCGACVAHVRAATDSGMSLKNDVRAATHHSDLDTFEDTRTVP